MEPELEMLVRQALQGGLPTEEGAQWPDAFAVREEDYSRMLRAFSSAPEASQARRPPQPG